jgi:arylsulfatase A-like enzyme
MIAIAQRILSPLLLSTAAVGWAADAAKPNVIVILADDLGYGDLGCYGSTAIATPNLDRLAADGVRFTDAHAPAAISQPTRYGVLTGRYYWRRQSRHAGFYFQENEATLPGVLRSAGYATACIGKWHLGLGDGSPVVWEASIRPGPQEAGFDYFFGTPRSHNEKPFVFMENDRVIGADPADPIREIEAKDTVLGWGHGISVGGIKAHRARPMDQVDIVIAKKAVEYLDRQSQDKPFFLYLPFVAPHVPLAPSYRFQGTSKAGVYGDYVQELDWCVGQVMETLDRRGLADNTLVVFTSDNGAALNLAAHRQGHRSNGNLLGQKTDSWEGGHRVPFIVRRPGVAPKGAVCDRLVSLTDIMATALAHAGVPRPAGAGPDSIDQSAVFKDPAAPAVRDEMVIQSVGGYALRQGRWVYLPSAGSQGFTAHPTAPWLEWRDLGNRNSQFGDDGKLLPGAPQNQLYDVVEDPTETVNVVAGHAEVAAKLAARLRELVPTGTTVQH